MGVTETTRISPGGGYSFSLEDWPHPEKPNIAPRLRHTLRPSDPRPSKSRPITLKNAFIFNDIYSRAYLLCRRLGSLIATTPDYPSVTQTYAIATRFVDGANLRIREVTFSRSPLSKLKCNIFHL
jgi:hypothetical protein